MLHNYVLQVIVRCLKNDELFQTKKATTSSCSLTDNGVKYHHTQFDEREPSCYLCTYRGVKYWSCYEITMKDWLEKTMWGD